MNPYSFQDGDKDSILIDMDLNFEKAIASMETAGVKSPGELNVFQFNQRIDFFKDREAKK